MSASVTSNARRRAALAVLSLLLISALAGCRVQAAAPSIAPGQPTPTPTVEPSTDPLVEVHQVGCGDLMWRRAESSDGAGPGTPIFFLAELPNKDGVLLGYFGADPARPISYLNASGATLTVRVRTRDGVVRLPGAVLGTPVW